MYNYPSDGRFDINRNFDISRTDCLFFIRVMDIRYVRITLSRVRTASAGEKVAQNVATVITDWIDSIGVGHEKIAPFHRKFP